MTEATQSGPKKQQTVVKSLETNSWQIWDRDKTKKVHEGRVNNLIREFERDGYSVTSIKTVESRKKYHCPGDSGTLNVFETNFVFGLR
ncbi:MAG: hypothetical protein AAB343_01365 [Patescibacteria group bacterium]